MSKYVIIDTETSGLPDFKAPADAPGQPHVASLAMIFYDPENSPTPSLDSFFIQPDGWTMDPEAEAVHGLSVEFLRENGVPIGVALDAYEKAILGGWIVVAFNAQFDLKMMRSELRRAGRPDLFEQTPNICVMRPMTDLCRIPHPRFKGQFKWPKLEQALAHFGLTNEAAHTADADAWGAYQLLLQLKEMGRLPEPAVHFAKTRSDAA